MTDPYRTNALDEESVSKCRQCHCDTVGCRYAPYECDGPFAYVGELVGGEEVLLNKHRGQYWVRDPSGELLQLMKGEKP